MLAPIKKILDFFFFNEKDFVDKYFVDYTFDGEIRLLVHVREKRSDPYVAGDIYVIFFWEFLNEEIKLKSEATIPCRSFKKQNLNQIKYKDLIKDDFIRPILFTPVQIAKSRIENSI